MRPEQLVLGIDGGGTKTVACLAWRSPAEEPLVVGRGEAGPSNLQAVGFGRTAENLAEAVSRAFADAGAARGPVAAAVLALAGSDRHGSRHRLHRWAEQYRLAARVRVVHDALPVLAAGTPHGWGIALISGTGSLAFGRTGEGRSARAGGWGYLLGDEGSGYAIARAGLRAAAEAADGRAPSTQLLGAMLARLRLERPEQLIPAVYGMASDPAAVAALAPVVTGSADQGDAVAQGILDRAAAELASLAAAVAEKLDLSHQAFPLALCGGTLLGSKRLQQRLRAAIRSLGLRAEPVANVPEPGLGAVKLAQAEAAKAD